MNTRPFLILLLTVLAVTASPVHAGEPSAATARVQQFHETLISVMKAAESLGIRGRYERLEPAVKSFFHLPLMIRIASGSAWTKGSDGDRGALTEAFERMSVATYADRFNGYSGEFFETDGTRTGPQETILVDAKINRPNKGDAVALVYVMREVTGEWRAVDVLLESGISELARYRSEYRKPIRDGGLEGLVAKLDAKVSKILSDKVAGTQ